MNFLNIQLRLLSNIHPKNTSIKDIHKKYTKHFQDPTRDLLDPMVEFGRWCPYFELALVRCEVLASLV